MEELQKLGYFLSFSIPSPVLRWGTWEVVVKKEDGTTVHGYGNDESSAFVDALKVVNFIVQNRG
jgi:hypothetical protein